MVKTAQREAPATSSYQLARFPALAKFGLIDEELQSLACQGFVCAERRRAKTYYKLRYRLRGKQCVRYIGSLELATAVNQELATLQRNVRSRRQCNVLHRAATEHLRQAKQALEPYLHARGFYYHGQAIRKRRTRKAGVR